MPDTNGCHCPKDWKLLKWLPPPPFFWRDKRCNFLKFIFTENWRSNEGTASFPAKKKKEKRKKKKKSPLRRYYTSHCVCPPIQPVAKPRLHITYRDQCGRSSRCSATSNGGNWRPPAAATTSEPSGTPFPPPCCSCSPKRVRNLYKRIIYLKWQMSFLIKPYRNHAKPWKRHNNSVFKLKAEAWNKYHAQSYGIHQLP